jgi:site-specific DNA recombinase
MTRVKRELRCAIYTRKSSDEGLEQEFNSIDAQREACEAYIRSQAGEGWKLIRARYDDGGYSGGTMERQALQQLLADIRDHKIDIVLVYKVDRLTRSLADFAKIVEVFDAVGISFVSVTQQFNTTTSMGRLTLNMLLSFAQFEREVTGERIRDKIAASKQRGMWMGGQAPLGYEAKEGKLVINAAEAETVRTLFSLYREVGTVWRLKEAADQLGLVTKRRRDSSGRVTGGKPFNRGHLYWVLSNPIYAGEVAHKGRRYPGQHAAIIEPDLFETVQQQLSAKAPRGSSGRSSTAPSLLTGLIRDETGDRLTPTHANKNGRRYRYYVSHRLLQRGAASGGWRLPARELESLVLQRMADLLKDEQWVFEALDCEEVRPESLENTFDRAAVLATEMRHGSAERQRQLLRSLLQQIVLNADRMRFEVKQTALARLLLDPDLTIAHPEALFAFEIPVQVRRRGVEAKLIIASSQGRATLPDERLIAVIADAHRWIEELARGTARSVRDLARRHGRDAGEVSRTLPLAFLAPDVIEAIVGGRQPIELTPRRLKRSTVPPRWEEQRRVFGVYRARKKTAGSTWPPTRTSSNLW